MAQKQQFDIAWKNILDTYFQDFLTLVHPVAAKAIDWSVPHEFLDKELPPATKGSAAGSGVMDKLVKVWKKPGKEAWILLHFEFQGEPKDDFEWRMFTNCSYLFDRYQKPVLGIAILADENFNWRPQVYQTSIWDCSVYFKFPIVKLLDFQSREHELEASSNPFAMAILAHLAALKTQGDGDSRLKVKLHLTRLLYQKNWGKEAIANLLNFINWVLVLSEELEEEYFSQLKTIEQEQNMNFITRVEDSATKIGLQKGMVQGERALLTHLLQQKFGDLPSTTQTQLEQADSPQLLAWSNALLTAHSLQDLFQANRNS